MRNALLIIAWLSIASTVTADYQYMRWSDATAEDTWGYDGMTCALVQYDMPTGYNLITYVDFYITAGPAIWVEIYNGARACVHFESFQASSDGWWHVNPNEAMTGTFYVGAGPTLLMCPAPPADRCRSSSPLS